jgi:membrane protein DedA with SNARE-associated domain
MDAVLEPIINATLDALRAGGVWAIFGLMILESCCIPAPSEVIMLFGGYLVWKGDATMPEVVLAGVAGNVIGSVACWSIGAYGGRPLIDRWGKYVRLNHHHVELAERFFARRGAATVFFARMLPIVRTFISLPAGIARMRMLPFVVLTTLGCIPWVWGIAEIGLRLGPNWEDARAALHRFDYVVVAAIVAAAAFLVVRSRRRRRARAGVASAAAPTDA